MICWHAYRDLVAVNGAIGLPIKDATMEEIETALKVGQTTDVLVMFLLTFSSFLLQLQSYGE